MKVIDILNKKANGTLEDGFKFIYKGYMYTYNKNNDNIEDNCGKGLLGDKYKVENILNSEVEVLEENKEIEEIASITFNFEKKGYTATELNENFKTMTELLNMQSGKIDELVREHNKTVKKLEEIYKRLTKIKAI